MTYTKPTKSPTYDPATIPCTTSKGDVQLTTSSNPTVPHVTGAAPHIHQYKTCNNIPPTPTPITMPPTPVPVPRPAPTVEPHYYLTPPHHADNLTLWHPDSTATLLSWQSTSKHMHHCLRHTQSHGSVNIFAHPQYTQSQASLSQNIKLWSTIP